MSRQLLDPRQYPSDNVGGKRFQLLAGRSRKRGGILAMRSQLPPRRKPFLHPFERLARVALPGLGDGAVVEVFPKLRVMLQIDDRRGLGSAFVHDKLHALHLAPLASSVAVLGCITRLWRGFRPIRRRRADRLRLARRLADRAVEVELLLVAHFLDLDA